MSDKNNQSGDAIALRDAQARHPQHEDDEAAAKSTTGARMRFDPRRILPGALGVNWGSPQANCHVGISGKVVLPGNVWSAVVVDDPDVPVLVNLLFDEGRSLSGISVPLYESRDFWDGDWEYDEMDAVNEEFLRHFADVERFVTELLGPPAFRGDWETQGIDEARLGPADEVAYWNHPEARIQLELSHEDKELPFRIDLRLVPPFVHG